MNAFANPVIVAANGAASVLERLPLSTGNEGQFSEAWLQNALFAHPECLPIKEIDPHIGILIPVCTEIETGAGPADILFVTPTGQIVLVETKLWRNPEARRAVVAQILDYAKELTSWSYEDLEREAARASGQGKGHLLSCVKKVGQTVDESGFVDGVTRSLKSGDFLLIIIGDGIRSGAESLVGFLEQYGNLSFRLSLLEVAAYRLPGNEILLQPRTLAKTEILQRTITLGPNGPVQFEEVATQQDLSTKENPQMVWFQDFWRAYLARLKLDDGKQVIPRNPARSTNMYFPMPPSGTAAWVSAYLAQSAGHAGVYLAFSKSFEKGEGIYRRLEAERESIEKEFGSELNWEKFDGNKAYISSPHISLQDLADPEGRQRVLKELSDMTNRFVNVFRHRLETYSRELG